MSLLLQKGPDGRPLLDDGWAERALARARSWSRTARLALSYEPR